MAPRPTAPLSRDALALANAKTLILPLDGDGAQLLPPPPPPGARRAKPAVPPPVPAHVELGPEHESWLEALEDDEPRKPRGKKKKDELKPDLSDIERLKSTEPEDTRPTTTLTVDDEELSAAAAAAGVLEEEQRENDPEGPRLSRAELKKLSADAEKLDAEADASAPAAAEGDDVPNLSQLEKLAADGEDDSPLSNAEGVPDLSQLEKVREEASPTVTVSRRIRRIYLRMRAQSKSAMIL